MAEDCPAGTRVTRSELRQAVRYLPILLAGRPLHGQARYRPFFIVGSGRSGTTLLRAMLEAHPDVHIPPENVLGSVVPVYRRYSRLPWTALLRVILTHFEYYPHWETFDLTLGPLFRKLAGHPPQERNLAAIVDALYRAHAREHKTSANRWGDKTPINSIFLPELFNVFPDLQVIQVIRDGRDVVVSLMGLPEYDLHRAACQWLDYVQQAQAFGARHPTQYFEVRYEQLIAQPGTTIEQVAAFLGIGFDERMLRHHELGLRLGDVEQLPHHEGVRHPIYRTAVGRWRNDLSGAQLAEVERLLGPTLARLGY